MPKFITDVYNVCFGIYCEKFVNDKFNNGKMATENWTDSNQIASHINGCKHWVKKDSNAIDYEISYRMNCHCFAYWWHKHIRQISF